MVTLAGRPVGTVRVLGGTESDTRFALNNLRSLAGSPLDAAIVRADIRRLTELGRFSEVVAKVTERPDGAVDLVYRVVLAPIIRSVEVQGNRRLGSEEILNRVPRLLGSIRDEALLERAARDVELWMRGEGIFGISGGIHQWGSTGKFDSVGQRGPSCQSAIGSIPRQFLHERRPPSTIG